MMTGPLRMSSYMEMRSGPWVPTTTSVPSTTSAERRRRGSIASAIASAIRVPLAMFTSTRDWPRRQVSHRQDDVDWFVGRAVEHFGLVVGAGEVVAAGAAEERVLSLAADEAVLAGAADENVVARLGGPGAEAEGAEEVVARPAEQAVVALVAADDVVAGGAVNEV